MTLRQAIKYVLRRGRFRSNRARLRAFYWLAFRHWETEICQNCGRPVRQVWWCHDDKLWTRITGNPKPSGRECAAGIWCIRCFDDAAREIDTGWIEWAPINLKHVGDPRS